VTAWYSVITREILKDNQRDREIRWIELKLRGLYYPLLTALDNYLGDLESDFPLKSVDAYKNKLYLGSVALRRKLEELRQHARENPDPRDLSMKLYNFVSSETTKLLERLEQLTTQSEEI
jgi:hypothetical protein